MTIPKNDKLVFDVETLRLSSELPNGWNDLHKMGVGICAIYSYELDRVRLYGEKDLGRLRARLEAAKEIIGFNSWGFDLPVIYEIDALTWRSPDKGTRAAHIQRHFASRSNDLLRRIWLGVGSNPDKPGPKKRGCSLSNIATATLNRDKIEAGADAPAMIRDGRILRAATYCIDDVFLTRDVNSFIEENGHCFSIKIPGMIKPAEAFDKRLQEIANNRDLFTVDHETE